MHRSLRGVLLVLVVGVTACGGAPDVAEPAGVTALGAAVQRASADASPVEVRQLTAAQTAFAVDLYRAVSDGADGDLALGPTSLHTALAMVRAGARGRTAEEMDTVLHTRGLSPHEPGNALDRALRSRSDSPGVDLDVANRVWVSRGLTLREQYVTTLTTNYGVTLAELDLSGDPEGARAAINAWVAEATRDKIEELFPDGSIDGTTELVLANALYLNAKWKFPFRGDRTTDQPFTLPDGSSVRVPTMHYDEYLPSGRGPGWTAVRLPYSGEQLSMTVIVPDDLPAFEQRLSPELLAQVEERIVDGGIHLSLPRFTARTHLSLARALTALGMPSAFGGGADFSGMTPGGGLFVSAVEHEAVVEVDEQGTEAAAASGVAMASSHGPTVIVDRPFLFAIRDEPTGAVLFLGRVSDPR